MRDELGGGSRASRVWQMPSLARKARTATPRKQLRLATAVDESARRAQAGRPAENRCRERC